MVQKYDFEIEFKIRDYECDMAGIVNNSVYLNYLEHARHEFINKMGLTLQKFLDEKIVPVVAHADLSYKNPLRSGENFTVKNRIEHSGLKYIFYQDIFRIPDNKLCMKAVVTTTSIVNGKLASSKIIVDAIRNVIEKRDNQ